MKTLLTGISGILIGLLARDLWHSYGPSTETFGWHPSAARSTESVPPQCGFDWQRMRAELRGALSNDRAARDGAESGAQTEPPAATAEQKQALTEQATLLDQAIEIGVWRDEDAVKLRTLLAQMAPQDRFGALTAIHRAINMGRLRVEAQMPF